MSTVSHRSLIVAAVVVVVMLIGGAMVVSSASATSSTPVVYVATGENFPDALGASAAAAVQGGPVLLVTKTSIPVETRAELDRLAPDVIYVAGGTAVVSDAVFNELKAYAPSVIRVAGGNRYSTAVEVSKSAFPVTGGGGDTAALEAAIATLTARLDAFDTDDDGVVDSAEVKIRYSDQTFSVDMVTGFPGRAKCHTPPVSFRGPATVVASGSLSLDPIGTSTASIYGYVYYTMDSGLTWTNLDGVAVHDSPPAGQEAAAVPINAAKELQDTETYVFAIMTYGTNHQATVDYTGYCELTVTIYSGQGTTTDFDEN